MAQRLPSLNRSKGECLGFEASSESLAGFIHKNELEGSIMDASIKSSRNTLLKAMLCVTTLLAGSLASTLAQAVDIDAGDYTALPDGTNLGLLYYQYATRDSIYADGHKVANNATLDSNIGIARGVHFMDIGGYIVDPQFLLPFGQLKAKDDISALGDASGVGDLILAATVWLVNQPKTDTYFGITPFLYVPIGSYDKDDALNIGENRWKLALQAGYITGLTDQVSIDLVGDVTFFGKNDEYTAAKATLKQDAVVQLQGFLRYKLKPTWDLRTGFSYSFGGETEVDGANSDDKIETAKFTVGTAWFALPTLQLMANYGCDLSVENGFREENRLNLRALMVF